MPIGSQPKRARGTVGHPYSALNLRMVLATFGVAACGVLAAILLARDYLAVGVIAAVLAAVAVVDLVIIQRRRHERHRTDPDDHSLFE